MDELGEVLERIMQLGIVAAVCGVITIGILAYERWASPPKVDAAKEDVQASVEAEQPKPSPSTYADDTEDALNRQREAQEATQQAVAAAAAAQAAAAQAQSANTQVHFQPEPTFQPAPAVYTGNVGADEPQNDVPVRKKHHWPRRFFGAIGHGFKAIGHGIAKVGKTIVGR